MGNMTNQKNDTAKIMMARLAGTPGYVLLLVGWLSLISWLLLTVADIIGSDITKGGSVQTDKGFVLKPLGVTDSVVLALLTIVAWYFVAIYTRRFVGWLARHFSNEVFAEMIITYGGLIASWLIVGMVLAYKGTATSLAFGLVLAAIGIGLISFAIEDVLSRLWKLTT